MKTVVDYFVIFFTIIFYFIAFILIPYKIMHVDNTFCDNRTGMVNCCDVIDYKWYQPHNCYTYNCSGGEYNGVSLTLDQVT